MLRQWRLTTHGEAQQILCCPHNGCMMCLLFEFFLSTDIDNIISQSTGRDAGTDSGTEKRRTIFCRGKGKHRKNTDPINEYRRGFFPLGRCPRRLFVYAAGLRCWIYSVKTQSYSLPVTASKSTPCFCCPVFSGGERQSFLLETVRGYAIIKMIQK